MDFSTLNGRIEAIEAETKNPSPSHQNLARLISMALSDIKALLEEKKEAKELVKNPTETVSLQSVSKVEVVESKEAPKENTKTIKKSKKN